VFLIKLYFQTEKVKNINTKQSNKRVSESGFTSEQRKKVIYGRVKHGKGRNKE